MSEQIRSMFSEISESYDLGNDVVSMGMHRLWKRRLVKLSEPSAGDHVLDLATGTGDVAYLFSRAVGDSGEVVGVDFSQAMISYARKRHRNHRENLRFEIGDVLDLRFDDASFDIVSVSYGVRNLADPVAGLKEMKRVMKPDGRLAVLETGQPSGILGSFYRLYSGRLVPFLGGLISGNFDAYRYLDRTAATFPYGEEFAEMMSSSGFRPLEVVPLFGGVSFIYIAEPLS